MNIKKDDKNLHIGIIMDGNGRWAKLQGRQRLEGHEAGATAMLDLIKNKDHGVSTFTVFAFATVNWKRDKSEVEGLWILFMTFIETHLQELIEDGVRFRLVGNREGIPKNVLTASEDAEARSTNNKGILLQVAINYDGVDEVVRMTQRALENNISPVDCDEEYVRTHLDTQKNNDLDILIRTGMPKAEKGMSIWRSSGFLPIQSTQSVCVSTEVLWPDFTDEHLKELIEYADPDTRLFGGQRK